ncbi:MAG: hypothetical protein ACLP2X_26730, partial [Syntrophobacteraceae bacterium]
MKAAPVKCETQRGAFNFVVKKISQYEIAFHVGLRGFLLCLLQSNLRGISTSNPKDVECKPYGI